MEIGGSDSFQSLNKTLTEMVNNKTNLNEKIYTSFSAELNITLYSVIFILSVCGNSLVIITLIKNKKMRTITNLFLVNLAISDLMLSVLCMPFSLVATVLLRNFIFGEAMCVIIRYFQAVSVGVSCYTLVAISLERYYAICEPLRSRRWQTLSHARRMLIGIWASVLTLMSPIAMFHRVIKIQTGGQACREVWPEILLLFKIDVIYSILLALILLLLPLLTMGSFYSLVAKKLWMVSTQMAAPSGHPPIAFKAILTRAVRPGPNQRIIFDDVKLNLGNALNQHLGGFIAPLNGTYLFSVYV
ncbi:cholecystokinin receptor-like [Dreissena polymorpha]|uniref:cholecystokinin receptor-like n=1 Tax=Dreissena polymorpha TaxID=45954 RepID=UPI0022654A61|nr:cholecystokinin receptor-like [Dreissena polymorpha]